ncbi:MAG: glycosyltransferase [Candidatus Bathyarchaeia archaeon]
MQIKNKTLRASEVSIIKGEGDSISIIIPTLNEALTIGSVISRMQKVPFDEIIVVDSSNDDTPKIAKSLGARVICEIRKGYGRALQTGVENAQGEIVVFIDGDGTYDPEDIMRIVKPILNGECDVVLGDRLNGRLYPGAMSLINRVGNILISLIFSVLFLRWISDTQCGLRAIRRSLLRGLSYRDYGMPYVTEQLAKLIKRGARIKIVPVTYKPRAGTTKLRRWTDGLRILKVIFQERLSR